MTQPVPKDRQDLLLEVLNRLIPSSRSLLIAALVGIVLDVLDMIFKKPELLHDAAFMGFVGVFAGGSGLGLAVSHMFGGTKAGSEVMTTQSDALIKTAQPPVSAPPSDGGAS